MWQCRAYLHLLRLDRNCRGATCGRKGNQGCSQLRLGTSCSILFVPMLGTEVCLILARTAGLSCQLHRSRVVLGNLARLLCDCRLCYLRSHLGPEARQWHYGPYTVQACDSAAHAWIQQMPASRAPYRILGPKSSFRHLDLWLQRVPLQHFYSSTRVAAIATIESKISCLDHSSTGHHSALLTETLMYCSCRWLATAAAVPTEREQASKRSDYTRKPCSLSGSPVREIREYCSRMGSAQYLVQHTRQYNQTLGTQRSDWIGKVARMHSALAL